MALVITGGGLVCIPHMGLVKNCVFQFENVCRLLSLPKKIRKLLSCGTSNEQWYMSCDRKLHIFTGYGAYR